MSNLSSLAPQLLELDRELFELVKDVEILDAVTPLNYKQERSAFLDGNGLTNPTFTYSEHSVDVFRVKRALFNLPVEDLDDEDLVTLYSDVIQSYVDKIDQLRSVGTPDFLYDCMRYYGEPSDKDVRNANFILHLPDEDNEQEPDQLTSETIIEELTQFAQARGYQYKITPSDTMIANILVSGTNIKVNRSAKISEIEMRALAHHEVGVHLVTTLNARNQPLKVLSLGCPVNTMTQEGLAILCEYLAGFMKLSRLKILALRVLAVNSMIAEKDFKSTFHLLREEHKASPETAFTVTARVYRGGGFTKDYLYLQGLHQMLNAFETRSDFNNLLTGKVSIDYLDLITRLVDKNILTVPKFISPAIAEPADLDPVHQFIAHAIK